MEQQAARGSQSQPFLSTLADVYLAPDPPDGDEYRQLVHRVQNTINAEDESVRPRDEQRRPGGVIELFASLPTLLVPDLHGRTDFLYSVFAMRVSQTATLADYLAEGKAQVVCVGDGFHTERRGAERWKRAFQEFQDGFRKHASMDEEMRDSFGTMEMVMRAKLEFPRHFHFLKGNHENIANESGDGNHGFRKYAYEGPMVVDYVRRFYGEPFLESYYHFEKNLPLLAIGNGFLVSHAEPATFFERSRVVNYRDDPEVIEGLTWTDNDAAEEGSVQRMLEHYLGEAEARNAVYFGGHRPVGGRYALRADRKYVQFHNPENF